jgi:hypothetical protein
MDCSTINCLQNNKVLEFRIVDKTTGEDLVFGNNPRYTTADVALYADPAHTVPIIIAVDDTHELFNTNFAKEEMYLVISGTDTYLIQSNFRRIDCCTSRTKDLRVEGQIICTCCADVIGLGVN